MLLFATTDVEVDTATKSGTAALLSRITVAHCSTIVVGGVCISVTTVFVDGVLSCKPAIKLAFSESLISVKSFSSSPADRKTVAILAFAATSSLRLTPSCSHLRG